MITMADYFCGAGGSSTGAIQVPGVRVDMAANHWQLAVDTHTLNHPTTAHDIADLSQVDPRRHPTTDIGWFSPECVNHTIAKGVPRARQHSTLFNTPVDAAADRSRATMWDVIRFSEHHRYRYVIVENVIEVRDWVLWPAWSMALSALGYEFRFISLNSMFAGAYGDPAAQSRNRAYVIAWHKGERAPDFDAWLRPFANCPTHGRVQAVQAWKPERTFGVYRDQYVWRCPRVECRNTEVHPTTRPAADIVDWTLPAQRIGDRKRPLVPNTLRRIQSGVDTYGHPVKGGTHTPPFMTELRGGGSKHRPITDPLSTVCAGGYHHGLTVPDMISPYYGNTSPRPATEPLPTVTTRDRFSILQGGTIRSLDDLRFRMLTPAEYANAMMFPADYQWLGTGKDKVRMAGNAVTPNAARDLVGMVVAAMTRDLEPVWGWGLAA